jgi:uncharacterized PurR-regulated membrane protein YhhQ (DUF165 family)
VITGIAVLVYLACIVGANWALDRWGLVTVGPFVVGAGTLFAGAVFVARDAVHERLGGWWAVALVVVGAALSWFVAPAFALASGVAFLLSELLDTGVYAPLRRRHLIAAVVASQVVGGVADTLVFLWLSPLPVGIWLDSTVVKWLCVLPAVAGLWWWRRSRGHLPERVRPLRPAV